MGRTTQSPLEDARTLDLIAKHLSLVEVETAARDIVRRITRPTPGGAVADMATSRAAKHAQTAEGGSTAVTIFNGVAGADVLPEGFTLPDEVDLARYLDARGFHAYDMAIALPIFEKAVRAEFLASWGNEPVQRIAPGGRLGVRDSVYGSKDKPLIDRVYTSLEAQLRDAAAKAHARVAAGYGLQAA